MQPPIEQIALPDSIIEKLTKAGRLKDFEKGNLIHQEGDFAEFFYVVLSGRISGYRQNTNGKSGMAYFLGPGSAFGLIPMMTKRPRSHNCEAVENSTLLQITRGALMSLIDSDPETRKIVFSYLCERLSRAFDIIDEERYETVIQRLAKRLIDFSDREGIITLTQQNLADQMGVSRVSLGAALKKLTRLQLIVTGYGKIRILCRDSLLEWLKTAQ